MKTFRRIAFQITEAFVVLSTFGLIYISYVAIQALPAA